VIGWLGRGKSSPDRKAPEPPSVIVAGRALPLVVRRLRHARRITLRLAPDGCEARVSLPTWGRTSDAVAFAAQRSDWLAEQMARIPPPQPIEPGGMVPYRGEALNIAWLASAPRRPVLDDGEVVMGGPPETVACRLRRWLESEAMRLGEQDLAHYCAQANVSAPRLALSSAQRRWGSCSADGIIRINWRLIMAPDAVRRSVMAHEVAHVTHFDHSPAFHAHLAAIFEGDVDDANRWLKREGRTLYRPFG
jgi:predicted metal-dependent hydrolase